MHHTLTHLHLLVSTFIVLSETYVCLQIIPLFQASALLFQSICHLLIKFFFEQNVSKIMSPFAYVFSGLYQVDARSKANVSDACSPVLHFSLFLGRNVTHGF